MRPPPSSVERQVAEIADEPNRAAAYARLLHLQRGCADDPSSAADLAAASPSTILPLLIRDAAADDEAVAASALKCLGFELYHPVLVSTISGQMAQLVLDSLVQLIMTTRMKAICNLGVWCISVQQLEALIIENRVTPLLTAIVYALDNPFGSLSTTFEAAQATMKLVSQNPERMRGLSSIWVPPIYRRLLSADKPERDMAERCLTKVSSVVLPPQFPLSKAVASDLEQKLLSCMMNMLDDPLKKVQAVKSWGWFISLLGSSAVSARPLLNKILKVPEKMFIDPDPQVQIATIGTWRNLVDAFFAPQASETMDQEKMVSPIEPRAHASAQLKKIRLIMIPLRQVLLRSRNIALSSSCLSTWHYLLYKLGDLINHLSILEAAFVPVLKIIFSTGLDNANKPLWSFCINLFHDFISVKFRHMASPGEYLCVPLNQNLLSQSCMHLKALLDVQHIKWLPWDVTSFDFQLEILGSIVNPELLQNMTHEMAVIVMDSATQIFRLLLQGVRVDCKAKFTHNNIQICITKACQFVKKAFLDLVAKQKGEEKTLQGLVDKLKEQKRLIEKAEEGLEDELDLPELAEENYGGYRSEVEDNRHKFDDEESSNASDDEYVDDHEEPNESYKSNDDQKGDDHSDLTASGQASWLDKIQQTVQNGLQAFNFFKTPVDLSEASRVRKEYDDASSKLVKIQSSIFTLTDKLKQDFGQDKEFYYFYDQCFESKEGKYLYKVCPYKKASQVEGHSSTNLGRWDKFEESYRVMHFSNGDRCWNGPDRSLKVRLRCGLSNELNDVDEPSRCEYVAVLSTPALCVEEKLKELEQTLEGMSSNQPGHDEL